MEDSRSEYEYILDDLLMKHPEMEENGDIDTIVESMLDTPISDSFSSEIISSTIEDEIKNITSKKSKIKNTNPKTTLQQYFNNVGFIYEKNNNECDIEYCPENRDKLIEMNLKCVIKLAKSYRGMGLSLEELISAGNEGLCIAYDKYDPNRNKVREELIAKIESLGDDVVDVDWLNENIGVLCKYGKLRKKYIKLTKDHDKFNAELLENWVKKNITKATFNSVAMLWVNAAIHQELDNVSRIIRKPKKEIEREKLGESKKEVYLDIDAPISDDSNNSLGDILDIQEDSVTSIDVDEAHQQMHHMLKLLFKGVKMRDKRILMQKFGIGYVRPMLPKEIGQRENISVARVSQIINLTISKMKDNAKELNINPNDLFQLLDRTNKSF